MIDASQVPGVRTFLTMFALIPLSRRRSACLLSFCAVLVPLAANAHPAAPGSLFATAGDEQAVLTWEDPSNSNIVRYEVRFGAGEAPEFNAWAKVPGSGSDTVEYTVSSLANGSRYVFEVRAVDEDGAGESASASTRLATAPSSAVEVPDAKLRQRIERTLGLTGGAPITQGDLAKLAGLSLRPGGSSTLPAWSMR